MDTIPEILFYVTLIANLFVAGMVTYSIIHPDRRIWPPSRKRWGWRVTMWVVFFLCSMGILALGVIDWGAIMIPFWLRRLVGVPLWLGGLVLIHWSMAVLGWAPSFGNAQGLTQQGPYRFSRNPQYLGFIAALIGWPLVASSAYTLLVGVLGAIILVITPFAEETWMLEQYGADYQEYMRCVPRFLPGSIRTWKALL